MERPPTDCFIGPRETVIESSLLSRLAVDLIAPRGARDAWRKGSRLRGRPIAAAPFGLRAEASVKADCQTPWRPPLGQSALVRRPTKRGKATKSRRSTLERDLASPMPTKRPSRDGAGLKVIFRALHRADRTT